MAAILSQPQCVNGKSTLAQVTLWYHQQTSITWWNQDPRCHIVLLGAKELTHWGWDIIAAIWLHFQMQFFHRRWLYFDQNFTKVCSQGSNQQQSSIGSDNGLARNRRQAIIWASDGLDYLCIYVSLSLNELIKSIHFTTLKIHTSNCRVYIYEHTVWFMFWNFNMQLPCCMKYITLLTHIMIDQTLLHSKIMPL